MKTQGQLPRGAEPTRRARTSRSTSRGKNQQNRQTSAAASTESESEAARRYGQEKREKKKTGQAKVTPPPEPKLEMTARPRAADSALYKTATIAAPPVRPGGAPPAASSSLAGAGAGGAMLPSALMKPSHISANPTPMVKPGTQVNITTNLFV